MKRIAALIGLLALGFLTACGGGNGGGQQQTITVTVGPKTASVAGGQTQTIVATILNPNNTGVTWTLSGTGCTGAACGSLSNPGGNNNQGWTIDYTAPLSIPSPATVTITATSKDDPTKSDTATITVTAAVVSVTVAPSASSVNLGATQQFTATVKGTTNTAVTWSTAGPGTINSSGLYTAPTTLTTPATVTVTATSQADNTKSGTATITIPAVAISVSPSTVTSVILGATQQFTATVTNATNTGVTWSVSGPGIVNSSGFYAAPATLNTPSTATVRATSQADPNKTVSVTFSIPAVTVSIPLQNQSVSLGATLQFAASVGYATNTAVTWSMTGVGTVSDAGLYTAPATLTTPSSATVIATSVADPSKSASTTITIPAVGVTVAPPTASLQGGASQTFTATVTKATNTSVTWSLSGLGTLGTNGAYTAPTVVPGQQTATITATSVADPSKSGSAVVTLVPVSVTVTPATATVAINTTQPFSAMVSGTSNTLVTWSVSGTGCSGSDCGTINSSGLYSAPDSVPNPATVTVKATSSADPTKFGTATVTITDNANARLNGSFAFTSQGFTGSNMTAMIGSFTADGQGNLTNGLVDVNTIAGTPATKQTFTGTYQLHGDGRGTMTFTSLPNSPSFRFALNETGYSGSFAEIDSTGTIGGGTFSKQTTTDFAASKIPGNYAFGFYGDGVGAERNAAVGQLSTNSAGSVTGSMDTSSPASTTLSGSLKFDSTTGSGNGRGTMSITVVGESGTFAAAFYMVNADSMLFLLVNQTGINAPLLLGQLRRQSGTFTASSLNGAAVFYSNGLSSTGTTTKALIGQFSANGVSTLNGEMVVSNGGSPMPLATFPNATYSVASNGRGVFNSTATGQVIFYLIGQNAGFLLWPTGAGLGMIESQTVPMGGFGNYTLNGRYVVAYSEVTVSSASGITGYGNFDGNGNWTDMVDFSSFSYGATDHADAGTYSVANSTTGRFNFTVTSSGPFNQILYVVSPLRYVVVDMDPSSTNLGAAWQATGFGEK